MKTTSLSFGAMIGATIAALSLAAAAQTPTKTITRDEYRACMDNQDAIKARSDALKARADKQKQEIEAVQEEQKQLLAEEKRVEESSFSGARDRFERKKKVHLARAKAAEDESKALQADFDVFSKDLDAHNAKCSNVGINKEDREAVTKEREAAGKK
jgi:hypothetical protein